MKYYGDVYRPPSEARSLIIQATLGCSNNTCAFCTMYKAKRFMIRPLEDVLADIQEAGDKYPSYVKRVFLADGDALAADQDYLIEVLDKCYELFPNIERVTSYATPQSIIGKTEEELKNIRRHGLTMLYMGLESGNDRILKRMFKGAAPQEIADAGLKARGCGFKLSVTAITGLGGREMIQEHALDTAKIISQMNPDYVGFLTLMVCPGTPLDRWVREGSFSMLDTDEIMEETRLCIENIDSPGTVFRMNHASNYLDLRGTFNQDKEMMLQQLDQAINHKIELKPEYYRGL